MLPRLVALLLAAILCFTRVHAFIQVDPETHLFVDSDTGSVRQFHGVNVVYKEAPYLPCLDCAWDAQESLNKEDMANLATWGFNFVRLGVMWVAVEPTQGQYNYTFLAEARRLVEALAEFNITTLVDMHQDLLSPATCGEGIPAWVSELATTSRACNESLLAEAMHAIGVCKSITEYGMATDPTTGDPLPSECIQHPFGMFYATPEVSSSFQSLFDNRLGVADAFRRYWGVVAETFAGSEAVIGYDLINEPFVGDLWKDVKDIAFPGHTDLTYLQPLYASLADVIRQTDPEHLLFYEPTPLPDTLPFFGGVVSPVGFNSTPGVASGSPAGSSQDVLSYHIYCCLSAPNACDSDGNPIPSADCDKYNAHSMDVRMSDVTRLGGGGFLTEFGACTSGDECLAEITRTTTAADSALQGWAYWQMKYYNDVTTSSGPAEGFYSPTDGSLVQAKVQALSRSYAQVVQGIPTSMSFDNSTAAFQLVYTTSNATAPTDIYVNAAWWYPSGITVQLQPSDMVQYQYNNDNHVILTHSPQLPLGSTVTVSITRS